ncbi:hypothetical protein ACTFIT_007603 [Dictyostelium discoideum]
MVVKSFSDELNNEYSPLYLDTSTIFKPSIKNGAIIKRNKFSSFQEINTSSKFIYIKQGGMIVIIETLLGKLHGYVTDFISHSIGIQTALFTNPFSVEFYANVSLQLNNGDCINADTSVGPFGRNVNSPSFIIETCISQSLPSGIEKIRKYFRSPNIMVTLLLKIFGRRADGTYVGLAILHRRVGTAGQCTSIISFGSHPTTPEYEEQIRNLLNTATNVVGFTPINPVGNVALNTPPYVVDIPIAQVFHGAPQPVFLQNVAPIQDFTIDLFRLKQKIDTIEDFTAPFHQ